jgi:hypothetical protein
LCPPACYCTSLLCLAVLAISFSDLLQLFRTSQQILFHAVMQGLLDFGVAGWGSVMVACSILLQLVLAMLFRAGLAAWVAYVSVHVLLLVVWGIGRSAEWIQGPLVPMLAYAVEPRRAFAASVAFGLTVLAVLRLQDVACVLLWSFGCLLAMGVLFAFLQDDLYWEEGSALLVAFTSVSFVYICGGVWYFATVGPSVVLPASAASSSSWLVRLAARATAAAAGDVGSAFTPAAAAGGAAAAAGNGPHPTHLVAWSKAAAAVRAMLLPQQHNLRWLHSRCEDAVMLTVALLVWELLGPWGDLLLKGFLQLLVEASVVVTCAFRSIAMLGAGAAWWQVWRLFWLDLQQMQQQQEGRAGRMQAQLIIHAQHPVFADAGGTADALRALADELEHMGGFDRRLLNGHLTLPQQPRWVHACAVDMGA